MKNGMEDVIVRDLRKGDRVFIKGQALTVTFVKKSRYVGFTHVQASEDGSIGLLTKAFDLYSNDTLFRSAPREGGK